MWQDWILMIGGFGFFLALIPSILQETKPARASSFITFWILVAFIASYSSLGLWKAAVSTGLTALTWAILFLQAGRRASDL